MVSLRTRAELEKKREVWLKSATRDIRDKFLLLRDIMGEEERIIIIYIYVPVYICRGRFTNAGVGVSQRRDAKRVASFTSAASAAMRRYYKGREGMSDAPRMREACAAQVVGRCVYVDWDWAMAEKNM